MSAINEMLERAVKNKLITDDVDLLISLFVKPLEELAAEIGEYPEQQARVLKAAAVLKGECMKIIKQGAPVKLYGECGGCHTIVETDTAEAKPLHEGPTKWEFTLKCPTCSCTISAFYKLIASDGSVHGGKTPGVAKDDAIPNAPRIHVWTKAKVPVEGGPCDCGEARWKKSPEEFP